MTMSRLVLERTVNGATSIENLTCVASAEGIVAHQRLKNEPGGPEGKSVWCWDSTPPGQIIAVDFTGAILCGATASQTQTRINAFKANPTTAPEDVLTYAE